MAQMYAANGWVMPCALPVKQGLTGDAAGEIVKPTGGKSNN